MERLVLNPTPQSQWYALVSEARLLSTITLSEDLESYLVFLLMRFSKDPDIARSIFAQDYLNNIHKVNKENQQALRDIGDKCLLFSGLFPNNAKRRRVRISYYVKLGQSAYSSLSNVPHNQLAELFSKLGNCFVNLMDVLHAIRALDKNQKVLDLLDAYELWSDTKSEQAYKILQSSMTNKTYPILELGQSLNIHSTQRH
jgi:hypothetical protein